MPPTVWPRFWPLLYLTFEAVRGWIHHEWVYMTLDLTVVVFFLFVTWERYGARLLIERYDAELEHLQGRQTSQA